MAEFQPASDVRAGLAEAERALLRAIIDGRLAWSYWSALALAGHAVETAAALEVAELVTCWRLPDGHALTLTSWGACVCGVWIVERVIVLGEELEEDPRWAELRVDDDGVAIPPPPLRLPKRAREVRYPWPDELPDPKAKPAWLIDQESEKPVVLFEGPKEAEPEPKPEGKTLAGGIGLDRQRGHRVKIDPKLAKGKPRRRGPKRAG